MTVPCIMRNHPSIYTLSSPTKTLFSFASPNCPPVNRWPRQSPLSIFAISVRSPQIPQLVSGSPVRRPSTSQLHSRSQCHINVSQNNNSPSRSQPRTRPLRTLDLRGLHYKLPTQKSFLATSSSTSTSIHTPPPGPLAAISYYPLYNSFTASMTSGTDLNTAASAPPPALTGACARP